MDGFSTGLAVGLSLNNTRIETRAELVSCLILLGMGLSIVFACLIDSIFWRVIVIILIIIVFLLGGGLLWGYCV